MLPAGVAGLSAAQQLFVNAVSGADTNPGTREGRLQSITEAARRVNADASSNSLEAIVAPGVYVLSQTALFRNNKTYTATNRLVILAEALPDDPRWHPQQMPTVSTAVPLEVDAGGETGDGIHIEINHVTIQGLRFTGGLDFYYKTPNQILRADPILPDGTKPVGAGLFTKN